MKTIIQLAAISGIFVSQQVLALTVEDLKLECNGHAKIVATSKPVYKPYKPPVGRAPEIPASAHFQASLEITSKSEGCAALESKYLLDLDAGPVEAIVVLKNPVNQQATEAAAIAALGEDFVIETHQSFSYVVNGKYLPFFPEIHGEKIGLTGHSANKDQYLSTEIAFSISDVYGIDDPLERSDQQKLNLAKKLTYALTSLGKAYQLSDIARLFLDLEPQAEGLKDDYADLVLLVLENIGEQYPFTQFFDFNVGGQGAFVGGPFASKIGKLSQLGVFSSEEKVDLLEKYPALLLNWGSCLSLSSLEIERFLESTLDKVGHLTLSKKYRIRNAVEMIALPQMYKPCVEGKVSPKAAALATEILLAIAQ